MDRVKNIRSFSDLQPRFGIVMARIRQAHIEKPKTTIKPSNNNNNSNNLSRGFNPPSPPNTPA